MSSGFQVSGLVTGMDTKGIIEAMVGVQRLPINKLAIKKNAIQTKISKFGEVKSKANELKTYLEDKMSKLGDVLAYTGTTTADTVAKITAGGEASPGSYKMTVNSLAVAEKDRSDGFNSEFTTVGGSSFTISINGEDPVEIDVAGKVVKEVVEEINSSDAGVLASIIKDGENTYIQLVSKDR